MLLRNVIEMVGFMGDRVTIHIIEKQEIIYKGYVSFVPAEMLNKRVATFKADQKRKMYIEATVY